MLPFVALSSGSGRGRRIELSATAKVNLALEILGRRADGYHEIVTVMQAVELSDRIVLEEIDSLDLRIAHREVPRDASNLALRAALALREAAGVEGGARISLDKRIPVAAGLGGRRADGRRVGDDVVGHDLSVMHRRQEQWLAEGREGLEAERIRRLQEQRPRELLLVAAARQPHVGEGAQVREGLPSRGEQPDGASCVLARSLAGRRQRGRAAGGQREDRQEATEKPPDAHP